MIENILQEEAKFLEREITVVKNLQELQELKAKLLGKNSKIVAWQKELANKNPEEKKAFGLIINKNKDHWHVIIAEKEASLKALMVKEKSSGQLDFTLPYENGLKKGSKHPITQTIDQLLTIMYHLGFKAVSGPEIEDDYHNFTALNIPLLHPARKSQDTFYLENLDRLLRTHTSSVQIGYMEKNNPPHYIVSVGKVYRVDSVDQTHLPSFHQIESLAIDEEITLLDLKEILQSLLKIFFSQEELPIRFRTSYFPFTSPSLELDLFYKGKWMEIGGCGMVHRKVLTGLGVDIEKYRGFAFGLGIERLAMIKYGLTDIRVFLENDIRFLKHFA
jgi:phenylalanyl-tRNA synthetase alpha chain